MRNDENNKKIILITGASSGIGQACAQHLAKRGYIVYGTSRMKETASNNKDIAYTIIKMDINDYNSVKEGIKQILDKEGRIDVVVNNAGYALAGAIEDTTIEEAKAQFETNFFGALRVFREVLPTMRDKRAGLIINISSIGGLIGIPFQGMYSASKFAVEGLTEVLRMEVKPFGLQVVLIEPGDFSTNLTANRLRTRAANESTVYEQSFKRAVGVMENDETKGPAPIKIAHLIDSIIKNPHPKLRYSIGPISERIAIKLKKILPHKLFEWIFMKYYKII